MMILKRLCQALIACGGLSAPALSAQNAQQDADFSGNYAFHIGGVPAADAWITGSVTLNGYEAKSGIETRGVFDLFRMQAQVSASVTGGRHWHGHFTPRSYDTDYATDGEAQAVRIRYSGGTPAVTLDPPEETDNAVVAGDALDPLTAAVEMMRANDVAEICNRTIPVFDGKRRYDIILLPEDRRPEGQDFAPLVWPTATVRCFGVYERIAGFTEVQQTAERYFPFDIWFEAKDEGLNRIIRVAGKTKLGHIVGVLQR